MSAEPTEDPQAEGPTPGGLERVAATGVAAALLVLQLVAYNLSYLTATQPTQCIVWPFGMCEPIMASGYASIIGLLGYGIDLTAIVAGIVPLWMWLAVAFAVHGPSWKIEGEDGVKVLSPEAKVYLVLMAVAVLIGATRMRLSSGPVRVGWEWPSPSEELASTRRWGDRRADRRS